MAPAGRLTEAMDWPAFITSTKDVLTAGAAIFATVTGWRALNRWQTESVGKRRLEVAGDALAGFYQMREIIRSVRAPHINRREMTPPEGATDKSRLNPFYGIQNRISQHSEEIGAFFSSKHIFSATFGPEYEQPWYEISDVFLKINIAVDVLVASRGKVGGDDGLNPDIYLDLTRIVARRDRDDEVGAQVDAAVAEMEKVCRPIMGRYAPALERDRLWRRRLGG
ncbi:hypothetical protein [Methylobacterium sp. Leaf117]|uniref:hypothetical protein n=1 Tax=Methylobacterium sp. Leaf117 TaxID=1736260 RepID=UPI000AE71F7F|nr:hypothetical protein [Methylobacterium sp. Leaf117]